MFVPGEPFQPSLMFGGKVGAYPSEAPFRLGWKGLPETNTLAYYENYAVKSVIGLGLVYIFL